MLQRRYSLLALFLLFGFLFGWQDEIVQGKINPQSLLAEDCTHLVGTGSNIRIAIVPSGFDGAVPAEVAQFEALSESIAAAFSSIEPYASNLGSISIYRANDYRGVEVNDDNIWYNPDLIAAAGVCDWNQIIAVAHNSGWAGGTPGYFSVVGSGTPETCDPVTCTGTACPWTPSCSWDENIGYTALHETGHTFAGLRHTCYPGAYELQLLESFERRSVSQLAADDPLNCGLGFTGSPDQPCSEWDNDSFLAWDLPGDPNFGCYQGCDDRSEWYRPWQSNTNIMCIDQTLENGFTPVDRKMLYDVFTSSTLYVPGDYATIGEALADARQGDTVQVGPGTYTEAVVVGAGITLQGADPATTLLDGQGADVVVLLQGDAQVSGFTITNSGTDWWDAGVWIEDGDSWLEGNIITGNTKGVTYYCWEPCLSQPVILNNWIYGNTSDGIVAIGGMLQIMHNTIVGNGYAGIALDTAGSLVLNNISVENIWGISTSTSSITLQTNNVWNNTVDYQGIPPGSTDISAEPLFVAAETGDYHLAFGSPNLDAGINLTLALLDIDGDSRPCDGDWDGFAGYDIGADEACGLGSRVFLPVTWR